MGNRSALLDLGCKVRLLLSKQKVIIDLLNEKSSLSLFPNNICNKFIFVISYINKMYIG